jgi:hypothetical protein
MRYQHTKPASRPKNATGAKSRPVASFFASSATLLRHLADNPLLSNDDRSRLQRYFGGIKNILTDLRRRSRLTEGYDITSSSPDGEMLTMLRREKDEVTAYAGAMIDIAQRLWLNNRMSEARYEELKALYQSLPRIHDEVRAAMEQAKEAGL